MPEIVAVQFRRRRNVVKTVVGEIFSLVEPRFAYAGMSGRPALSYFPSTLRSEIMEAAGLDRLLRFVMTGCSAQSNYMRLSSNGGATELHGSISTLGA
jgi:hypothetical protein